MKYKDKYFVKISKCCGILSPATTIVLSMLLILAVLALWGDVFAHFFKWIPGIDWLNKWYYNDFFPSIKKTLSECSFTPILLKALYSPADASLSPAEVIFELIGFINFAFTAINEVASTRYKGILLEKVISARFRGHRIILIFLQILFVTLGKYSCKMNNVYACVWCLLALLICFIYSAIMIWKIVLPSKARNTMIQSYLCSQKCWTDPNNTAEQKNLILNFSSYIGQQGSKGPVTLRYQRRSKNGRYVDEFKDDEILLFDMILNYYDPMLIQGEETKESNQINTSNACIKSAICSVYEEILNDCPYDNFARYLIFTKTLSANVMFEENRLIDLIVLCRSVWETMFEKLDSDKKRKRLAFKLLFSSHRYSELCFTVLCCSLMLELGVADRNDSNLDIQDQMFDINFCADLDNMSKESSEDTAGFYTGWCELMYLCYSAHIWKIAFGMLQEEVTEKDIHLLDQAINENKIAAKDRVEICYSQNYYLFCALLTLYVGNNRILHTVSGQQIKFLLPVISKRIQNIMPFSIKK